MAEELRVVKGDSHELIVTVKRSDGSSVDVLDEGWNIDLETDASINKNSIDNPDDFVVNGNIVSIYLSSSDTGAINGCPRKHYKIRLYKDNDDETIKTISTGDLIFVDEV